ncbi:hypothetical protein Sjap_011968 [Stephania japonica]|uniref:Uncharacterized protein n=1 Tax=Stephania japonica TaxID=461633 RepID=A0AAP0JCB3_9MAGN
MIEDLTSFVDSHTFLSSKSPLKITQTLTTLHQFRPREVEEREKLVHRSNRSGRVTLTGRFISTACLTTSMYLSQSSSHTNAMFVAILVPFNQFVVYCMHGTREERDKRMVGVKHIITINPSVPQSAPATCPQYPTASLPSSHVSLGPT